MSDGDNERYGPGIVTVLSFLRVQACQSSAFSYAPDTSYTELTSDSCPILSVVGGQTKAGSSRKTAGVIGDKSQARDQLIFQNCHIPTAIDPLLSRWEYALLKNQTLSSWSGIVGIERLDYYLKLEG